MAAYAVFKDGAWSVDAATDDGHDGWDNRITVDNTGAPHMSAIDPMEFGGNGVEYYGLDAEGAWQVEEVGSGPLSYKFATSVAVDPQGNPHITYYDQTDGDLKLASRTPSGWDITTIDAAGETGLFAEMVIGQDGRFHVSYYSRTSGTSGVVKYATKQSSGSAWEITEVGPLSNVALGQTGARNITSVALDSGGNPWIAFGDEAVVMLAVRENGTWRVQTVAERGVRPLGQLVSLAIDASDNPHITYFQVTGAAPLDGMVMYAKGMPGN